MKFKLFAVIGVAILSVLMLTACDGGNQPADEPTAAPVVDQPVEVTDVPTEAPAQAVENTAMVEPTAAEEAAPTAEMDMEAFIAEKVNGHHDLGRIFNATKTRAEWESTLDRMIGYGAKINDQEKEMIIDYLLSR